MPTKTWDVPQRRKLTALQNKLAVCKILIMSMGLLFAGRGAQAQSEVNDAITYDTTITEKALGQGPYTWNVRITRQKNDAAQRPALLCIPGVGEVGSDKSKLQTYGPHFWLKNGWDGGVTLGNGKHYPILITIQQPVANMRPWHLKAVLETLLQVLPIKKNSVHVTGLSQGSYEWGELIQYAAFSGDEAAMSMIKSWVNLEGVGPGDNFSGFNVLFPLGFSTWAKKYGGKFFGLEGTTDTRNVWLISEMMNLGAPGSAFFSYENIGGGGHCCWNSMYDPSVTNWTSANGNVKSSLLHPSTAGTYKAGSNIFQWMLRQGDTALVSSGTQTPSKPTTTAPTVSAGSAQTITLPTSSVTLTGTATAGSGTLSSTKWTLKSGPSGYTIVTPASLKTSVTGLTGGTYIFTLTAVNSAGGSSSGDITVTVKVPTTAPTVSAGSAQSITQPASTVTLTGTVTPNGGSTVKSQVWSLVSGPGTPVIATSTALSTRITGLVVGSYVFQLLGTNSFGNSASARVTITVVKSAVAPTVSAGSAQTITLPTSSVTLTGTITPNGGSTVKSQAWSLVSGPNKPVVANAAALSSKVTGLVAGAYVFQMTGTNSFGNSASAKVTITVKAAVVAPTVTAGSAQNITLPTNSTTLTGTMTPNGGSKIKKLVWTRMSGPSTPNYGSANSLKCKIMNLVAGTYVFQLTGTNTLGASASASVNVTVVKAVVLPTVSAGSAQSITQPTSTVTLTGKITPNGGSTVKSQSWSLVSGPNSPVIATATALSTRVTGLVPGSYVFKLTGTNSLGSSATSTVGVTVVKSTVTPTVSAGSAQTITLPTSSVTVTGTLTPNGGATAKSQAWSLVSGPNTPTIANAAALSSQISGLIAGSYVFKLTGTNSFDNSASATVAVTVNKAVSNPSSGTATPPAEGTVSPITIATGEYQVFFIDQNKLLWASGGNLRTQGTGALGKAGTAVRVLTSPANLKFKAVASGLHGGLAVDTAGYVWSWGDGIYGQIGNGVLYPTAVEAPIRITVDATGKAFNNVTAVYSYYSCNAASGNYALKADGTLWIWGDTRFGMKADGTKGGIVTRPTQVTIPGGRKVAQIACGNTLIVLCTDGTVWSSGGGTSGLNPNLGYNPKGNEYLSLQQLPNLSDIVQVAGGGSFNYALNSAGKLYGWGFYGCYMGGTGGLAGNTRFYTPVDLTTRLNLRKPVRQIVANMVCTHAVLTDGSLWGWGDNAVGSVGNGKELDYSKTTLPYSWDFGAAELLQQAPVQITNRVDFAAVYGAGPFVLYNYAVTTNGEIYSWGRNKGSVLGNGIAACTTYVTADYPNSWDVPLATKVSPLTVTSVTLKISPYCATHSLVGSCVLCMLTMNLTPTAVATVSVSTNSVTAAATSVTQSTVREGTASSLSLTATNDVDSSTLLNTGEAATVLADTVAADTTQATAATGVTTQTTTTSFDTTTGVAYTTDTAAGRASLTVPQVSTAFLDGSQSIDNDGSIVAYAWSQKKGPAALIRDTSASRTEVSGLVPGTYVFALSVTDDQGAVATTYDTLTVQAAAGTALNGGAASTTALQIYPTLAHDNINLRWSGDDNGTVKIMIYDAMGRVVHSEQTTKDNYDFYRAVGVSSLASGAYIVQVYIGAQQRLTGKFVRQ